MISQNLISDERFNALTIGAQNIFTRMLVVSDDCGVVPADPYRLGVLINPPKELADRMGAILAEILERKLGHLYKQNGNVFFIFKPESFKYYQSYILNKATKSEYLRIARKEFLKLSKNLWEGASRAVESRE